MNNSKMGKLCILKNNIFSWLVFISLTNCATTSKSSISVPKLTVIVVKTRPEKQSNFRIFDLGTNQKFDVILQDSIYQIKQSALKEFALVCVDGYFSHSELTEYYKTGKNDTIYIVANFAVFIE